MTTAPQNSSGRLGDPGPESLRPGFLVVDQNGRIIVADRFAAGLLGSQRNDLIGRHLGLPSTDRDTTVDVSPPVPPKELTLQAARTSFGESNAWIVNVAGVPTSSVQRAPLDDHRPSIGSPSTAHGPESHDDWPDTLLTSELERSIDELQPDGNSVGLILLPLDGELPPGGEAAGRGAANGVSEFVATASVIRDHIRQDDVILPVRGEELAVVCNELTAPGGRSMLDRIGRALDQVAADGPHHVQPLVLVLTRDRAVDSAALVSAGRTAARRAQALHEARVIWELDSGTTGSVPNGNVQYQESAPTTADAPGPLPRRRRSDRRGPAPADVHDRFSDLVDSATDGIVVVDAHGVLVFANAAAASMFGRDQQALIGQIPGVPVVEGTMELELVDQRHPQLVLFVEVRTVRSEWEGATAWLLVMRDISERHSAELALMRANADMMRSTAELEAATVHMAHDLRQPITAVARCLTEIRERISDDPRTWRLLDLAYQGLDAMRTQIDGVLEQSQAPSASVHLEAVDTRQVAEECKAMLSEERGTITIGPLPRITSDRRLLRQILQNLIENGIRHNRSGVHPHVVVEAEHGTGSWLFMVTDNGPGVPDDLKEQIFRPFWSTRSGGGGSGIGLAAAERAVLRLGGSIWVEASPWGPGSRFCFTLSADPSELATFAPRSFERHSPDHGLHQS